MIGDRNKRSEKHWGIWVGIYLSLTAIHYGISIGIYDPMFDIVFEPITSYEATILYVENFTYGKDYTIVWTLELVDQRTQVTSFGHACESSYAKDSLYKTIPPFPYKRYHSEGSVLHWFCSPPAKEKGTAIQNVPLYVSTTSTHSSNDVKFRDVVFSKVPYFPEVDWVCQWVIIIDILIISACVLVVSHTWEGSYILLGDLRDMDPSFTPFLCDLDRKYFDRTNQMKMIEILLTDLCRILGPVFIFTNLSFDPYTDNYGSLFRWILYFWIIGCSVDLGHVITLFYVYSKRSWRRHLPTWLKGIIGSSEIDEPTTWLLGSWPCIGSLIRPFLNDGDRANVYAYHDSLSSFYGFIQIQQVIVLSFYLRTEAVDSLGLTYYVLMCIHLLCIAHNAWHKTWWITNEADPYKRRCQEALEEYERKTSSLEMSVIV